MSLFAIRFAQLEEALQGSSSSLGTRLDSPGRLLALDLGARRIGVAVSDELRITTRPLAMIERRSWKRLVREVAALVASFEAKALVIGLPLRLDGAEGSAADEVRGIAENFRKSLEIPIYLQDERLTSSAARENLESAARADNIERQVDSEAAAIILRDFIGRTQS